MRHFIRFALPVLSLLACAALGVSGCARIDALRGRAPKPAYGDVAFKGPPIAVKPRRAVAPRPVCQTSDLRAAQNDPACVGTVLRATPTGPTITVLEPGLALPPAPMEAETLAPPQ